MKKLLNAIFNNIHYKVLAVGFAVLLWLLATNREITEAEIQVKIHPISTGNYRVIDYKPHKLSIVVEGYRKDLLILKEKPSVNLLLPEDIKSSDKSKCEIELKPSDIILPVPSAKIRRISPNKIEVAIERLVKKVVPVKLNATGVKRGLKLRLSPNYVIVYVPEEVKKKIKYVKTEKIDLSSIRGKGEIYLKILSKYRVEPDTVKLIFWEEK